MVLTIYYLAFHLETHENGPGNGSINGRHPLSVWTNLGKHLLFVWLCVSSIKTGTRRIVPVDEYSYNIVLLLKTHNIVFDGYDETSTKKHDATEESGRES